ATAPSAVMPGAPRGPAFFSTRKSSALTSSVGSSIRLERSSSESNTTARPSLSNSRASAAERLRMGPPARLERAPRAADHGPIPPGVVGRQPLAERLAGDRQAVKMEMLAQLAQ